MSEQVPGGEPSTTAGSPLPGTAGTPLPGSAPPPPPPPSGAAPDAPAAAPPPVPMPPPPPPAPSPYAAPPPGAVVAPSPYAGLPTPGVALPPGVVLAGVGRRIGAYFLALVLVIVTLGIGYLIWGLIVWRKGTSPALSVLGMKCWVPEQGKVAGWGRMALRDIIGRIAGALFGVMAVISFVLFMSRDDHKAIHDLVGGTIVVHDPNKVLG